MFVTTAWDDEADDGRPLTTDADGHCGHGVPLTGSCLACAAGDEA